MAEFKIDLNPEDLNINPEDVNKAVAEAVLASSLGKAITEQINDFVRGRSWGSDSLSKDIEIVVKKEMASVVHNLVHKEYREKIEEMVRSKLTDQVIEELCSAALAVITEKLY